MPILQATLAELENEGKEYVQIPLAQISWYHHISLLSKVKDEAQRAYYITETAQNGWSRDVMLLQIGNGYIHAKGHTINNFEQTLPPLQSDLARYIFKDPYNRYNTLEKGGLDLYLENSPLFKADQVTTPLLIMHNDNDGAVPWYQGIEYFMALRRLGTKRILLELEAEQKQHKLLIFK